MITHNNLSNFDSEFFRNQIEILSGAYFPEFDQKIEQKLKMVLIMKRFYKQVFIKIDLIEMKLKIRQQMRV